MPFQHLWAFERGALWALDLDREVMAPLQSSVQATFSEATAETMDQLATAMGLGGPSEAQRRFAAGSRCFVAWAEGVIAGYGWVSQGVEYIGELEQVVRLKPDEAYIWDCATLPPFRRQGVYSALLAHMAATMRREGLRRLWIGASLQNRPSLKGFLNAGFQPAVTVVYLRVVRLSYSWVVGVATASPALIAAGRSALERDRGVRGRSARDDHHTPDGAHERVRERGSLHHGGTA